jgi:hypothetical protein
MRVLRLAVVPLIASSAATPIFAQGDGDVWLAIDGHGFIREPKLARVNGPGIPARLTIARGDSVFDRIVTPGPAHPCKGPPAKRGT